MTLRYTTVTLKRPRHTVDSDLCPQVTLQVVLAEELTPPPDVAPICGLLLTTFPLTTVADARQCVRWYSYRWLIERYHFVLKSGCHLEELQLETAARLHKALATYAIVAWRLLWLTYAARHDPTASCEVALESYEWQALYCTLHHTANPPAEPPSLGVAVRWIAQLGGFLARRRDGEPGVKTIWRGLRRLHDIAHTWQLLNSDPPSSRKKIVGNE